MLNLKLLKYYFFWHILKLLQEIQMLYAYLLNQVLSRSGRDEQATMTTLAGLVVVLMMVVQEISDLFKLVKNLFGL